jgi:hypothetical protein
MSLSESSAPPDPADCALATDVGRLHHDTESDIWYECAFDRRHEAFTWTILPPND